jgi:hypothetical protein
MPRLNLYLDEDQVVALRKIAADYRLSVSALLRIAVDRIIRQPRFFIAQESSDTSDTLADSDGE